MNREIVYRVAQTMKAMVGEDTFPKHDREWWIDFFSDHDLVEQLITTIAWHYQSHDEGMCKLIDIIESHSAKEFV